VLLEKEPDADRGDGRVAGERRCDDRVEVEELDHLQRAPDLLEAAADVGGVNEINEGSLVRRDADRPSSVPLLHDTGSACTGAGGWTDGEEAAPAESERRHLRPGGDVELVPDGGGPAPELERSVKRDGGVGRQLRRDEVWVGRECGGVDAVGDDGVEAPAHVQETPGAHVVGEEIRPGPRGGLVSYRPEVASGEDGVRREEIERFCLRRWSKRHKNLRSSRAVWQVRSVVVTSLGRS